MDLETDRWCTFVTCLQSKLEKLYTALTTMKLGNGLSISKILRLNQKPKGYSKKYLFSSMFSNVGHQSIVKVHTKYKVGNVIFPTRRSNYS